MSGFSVGDVVAISSGDGLWMTVSSVARTVGTEDRTSDRITCIWRDGELERTAHFTADELVLIDDGIRYFPPSRGQYPSQGGFELRVRLPEGYGKSRVGRGELADIGDVVVHGSSERRMTVANIAGVVAICRWSDDSGIREEGFSLGDLRVVERAGQRQDTGRYLVGCEKYPVYGVVRSEVDREAEALRRMVETQTVVAEYESAEVGRLRGIVENQSNHHRELVADHEAQRLRIIELEQSVALQASGIRKLHLEAANKDREIAALKQEVERLRQKPMPRGALRYSR